MPLVMPKKKEMLVGKHLMMTVTFTLAFSSNCNIPTFSYITYHHSYCAFLYVPNLPPIICLRDKLYPQTSPNTSD